MRDGRFGDGGTAGRVGGFGLEGGAAGLDGGCVGRLGGGPGRGGGGPGLGGGGFSGRPVSEVGKVMSEINLIEMSYHPENTSGMYCTSTITLLISKLILLFCRAIFISKLQSEADLSICNFGPLRA